MKLTCPNWGETGRLISEFGVYRCGRCGGNSLSEEGEQTKLAQNSYFQGVFD